MKYYGTTEYIFQMIFVKDKIVESSVVAEWLVMPIIRSYDFIGASGANTGIGISVVGLKDTMSVWLAISYAP